jgi:hypothetical protein
VHFALKTVSTPEACGNPKIHLERGDWSGAGGQAPGIGATYQCSFGISLCDAASHMLGPELSTVSTGAIFEQ